MVYVDPPQSPAWHVHPRFCLFSVSLSSLSLSSCCLLLSSFFLLLFISFISFISFFFISFLCISSHLIAIYCSSLLLSLVSLSSHLLRPADYSSSLFLQPALFLFSSLPLSLHLLYSPIRISIPFSGILQCCLLLLPVVCA